MRTEISHCVKCLSCDKWGIRTNLLGCQLLLASVFSWLFCTSSNGWHSVVSLRGIPLLTVSLILQITQSVWSAGSPPSVTWLWVKNGPKTCRHLAGLNCVIHTVSCVTSITTVMAALSFAAPEMTPLDTSPVASVGKLFATLAGRASTALNVSLRGVYY